MHAGHRWLYIMVRADIYLRLLETVFFQLQFTMNLHQVAHLATACRAGVITTIASDAVPFTNIMANANLREKCSSFRMIRLEVTEYA